jgi:hypothetical protein
MQKLVLPKDLNDPLIQRFFSGIPLSEKDMKIGDIIKSNFNDGQDIQIKKRETKKTMFDELERPAYSISFDEFKTCINTTSSLITLIGQQLRLRDLSKIKLEPLSSKNIVTPGFHSPSSTSEHIEVTVKRQNPKTMLTTTTVVTVLADEIETRLKPVVLCFENASDSLRYNHNQLSASKEEKILQNELNSYPLSTFMLRFSENQETSNEVKTCIYHKGQCIVSCLKTFIKQFQKESAYAGKLVEILDLEDLKHIPSFNDFVLPDCSKFSGETLENETFTWLSRVSSFIVDLIGSTAMMPTYVMKGSKDLSSVIFRRTLVKVGAYIDEEKKVGFNNDFYKVKSYQDFLKLDLFSMDVKELFEIELNLLKSSLDNEDFPTEKDVRNLYLLFRIVVSDDHWVRLQRFYEVMISRERLKLMKVEAKDIYIYAL